MMMFENLRVGFGITGSFCTFSKILPELEKLAALNTKVFPILSYNTEQLDTRFGKAKDWIDKFEKTTGNKVITTIQEAEPIGPNNIIDILVIAPCTGNA